MTYNEQIKQERISLGLKQSEVADAAGCTQGMVSKVENGTLPLSMELLERIASGVGLSLQITLTYK